MNSTLVHSPPLFGILGGGQLARMLVQAATQLGCRTAVMERDPEAPAMSLATYAVTGDWNDAAHVSEFARRYGVVTVENEFVDADVLAGAEADQAIVRPGSATIRLLQDKFTQREAFARAGLPVPDFAAITTEKEVARLGAEWRWPLVLKTRRNGYDGRGTAVLRTSDELSAAWARLRGAENLILAEQYCPFERELAVIVARSATGEVAGYPVVETVQENNVCRVVRAPAGIPPDVADRAREIAAAAVTAVNGVGCFGVELFQLPGGRILINEVAPRVHNSGHYTIEACVCSQFENHVRAVMGWPLGSTAMRVPAAAMVNVLGSARGQGHPAGLTEALQVPGAHLHLYGKRESAPGRKMGHVTALGRDIDQALTAAESAAAALQFPTLA